MAHTSCTPLRLGRCRAHPLIPFCRCHQGDIVLVAASKDNVNVMLAAPWGQRQLSSAFATKPASNSSNQLHCKNLPSKRKASCGKVLKLLYKMVDLFKAWAWDTTWVPRLMMITTFFFVIQLRSFWCRQSFGQVHVFNCPSVTCFHAGCFDRESPTESLQQRHSHLEACKNLQICADLPAPGLLRRLIWWESGLPVKWGVPLKKAPTKRRQKRACKKEVLLRTLKDLREMVGVFASYHG